MTNLNTEDAELVERVAKAIHMARGGEHPWFHADAEHCEKSRELARAALTASGISRVEEENVRLREALTWIEAEVFPHPNSACVYIDSIRAKARAALAPKER